MTKGELVKQVAAEAGVTQREVDTVLETTVEAVRNAVAAGEDVSLAGLGTFRPVERSARKGRDPSTGKAINIPAKTVVKFRPAAKFRQEVAG